MTTADKIAEIRDRLTAEKLPAPVSTRSGCKVSWETYAEKADAEKRAKYAKEEAEFVSLLGFDFGFQSPGTITATKDGWEVCLP